MSAGGVVERLDEVENCSSETGSGWPVEALQEFPLQRREQLLGDGVDEDIADGSHRAEQAGVTESLAEHPLRVWAPWSGWTVVPSGRRRRRAISNESTTSSARR